MNSILTFSCIFFIKVIFFSIAITYDDSIYEFVQLNCIKALFVMPKIEGSQAFFCYLLESQHTLYRGSTYIGFTTNPKRRIRQHNGEIKAGK